MLLYLLEWELSPEGFGASPLDPPRPIEDVAGLVTEMKTDDLVAAMLATSTSTNPWSGAPPEVTEALRSAPTRRAIAEAVVATHRDFLTASLDRHGQVVWVWGSSELPPPGVGDLALVYECGEFPGGLRTHTAVSSRHDGPFWWAHDGGRSDEVREWRLTVSPDARVAEVHSPDAWLELVRRHPSYVTPFREDRARRELLSGHLAWDIRLRSVEPDGTATVELIDGSQKTGVSGLLMPDWTSVATEFDAVHLSWAGFLLAEANVVDAGDGWLTVLRYWASEQTVFLSDAFNAPEPVRPVDVR